MGTPDTTRNQNTNTSKGHNKPTPTHHVKITTGFRARDSLSQKWLQLTPPTKQTITAAGLPWFSRLTLSSRPLCVRASVVFVSCSERVVEQVAVIGHKEEINRVEHAVETLDPPPVSHVVDCSLVTDPIHNKHGSRQQCVSLFA